MEKAIERVLASAEKLAKNGGNEANTKALLIEPLLSALGWDTADIDHVEREYRVFDSTFLDYALRIDGDPRLFIEAKALGSKLDSPQFVAQAINYANNEGVVWCVLTDGVSYRVYKSNEAVAMDGKLLFEVDLAEFADETAQKRIVERLRFLDRRSIERGELDEWGDSVFIDKRLRTALAGLAASPVPEWLDAIRSRLGVPAVPENRLLAGLARVLDVEGNAGPEPPPPPKGGASRTRKPAASRREYGMSHHLDGKSAEIQNLVEQLDEQIRALGTDVERRIRKQYVGYFVGKQSFVTFEVQRSRVVLYLSLNPQGLQPWDEASMRDVTNKGHWGMGDTEFSLRTMDQLGLLFELIDKSLHRLR